MTEDEFLAELKRKAESGELKKHMANFKPRSKRPGRHTGARVKR